MCVVLLGCAPRRRRPGELNRAPAFEPCFGCLLVVVVVVALVCPKHRSYIASVFAMSERARRTVPTSLQMPTALQMPHAVLFTIISLFFTISFDTALVDLHVCTRLVLFHCLCRQRFLQVPCLERRWVRKAHRFAEREAGPGAPGPVPRTWHVKTRFALCEMELSDLPC